MILADASSGMFAILNPGACYGVAMPKRVGRKPGDPAVNLWVQRVGFPTWVARHRGTPEHTQKAFAAASGIAPAAVSKVVSHGVGLGHGSAEGVATALGYDDFGEFIKMVRAWFATQPERDQMRARVLAGEFPVERSHPELAATLEFQRAFRPPGFIAEAGERAREMPDRPRQEWAAWLDAEFGAWQRERASAPPAPRTSKRPAKPRSRSHR